MELSSPSPIYTALSGTREIRLLRLDRTQHLTDDIHCTLHHANLDEDPHPTYSTLSYVWGDPTITTSITCNGKPINITANLANALRRLRQLEPDKPTIIWADALCINQQDIPERNHQVTIMNAIYKRHPSRRLPRRG